MDYLLSVKNVRIVRKGAYPTTYFADGNGLASASRSPKFFAT